MTQVSFFTPIYFWENRPPKPLEHWIEKVDGYFAPLSKNTAYVLRINGRQTQPGDERAYIGDTVSFQLLATIKKIGTVAILLSYLTIVVPVAMLIAKFALRKIHPVYLGHTNEEVRAALHGGMKVPEGTQEALKKLMPHLMNLEDHKDISWLSKKAGKRVFMLSSVAPDFIFKIFSNEKTQGDRPDKRSVADQWWKIRMQTQRVVLDYKLTQIVVPSSQRIDMDKVSVIVEKKMSIDQKKGVQEENYRLAGLEKAIEQFLKFIVYTNTGVECSDNIPVENSASVWEDKRIVLLTPSLGEGSLSPRTQVFGTEKEPGFIDCLESEYNINLLLKHAMQYRELSESRLTQFSFEDVRIKQTKRLERNEKLKEFYQKNNILDNPRRPIDVANCASLGLALEESDGLLTLKQAAQDVVATINDALTKAPENSTAKASRFIVLYGNSEKLKRYRLLYTPPRKLGEYEKSKEWVRAVIDALVAKGYLFELVNYDEIHQQYFIQA